MFERKKKQKKKLLFYVFLESWYRKDDDNDGKYDAMIFFLRHSATCYHWECLKQKMDKKFETRNTLEGLTKLTPLSFTESHEESLLMWNLFLSLASIGMLNMWRLCEALNFPLVSFHSLLNASRLPLKSFISSVTNNKKISLSKLSSWKSRCW